MSDTPNINDELIRAAEKVLSEAVKEPVRLRQVDVLREKYRNRVARLAVESGPTTTPATVIAKQSAPEEGNEFAPDNDDIYSHAWRFRNEWAGTAFLNRLGEPLLSARLLGADPEQGIIVLEDLGTALSLANRMQETDRAALESALFIYARSLGRLNAETIGRETEFNQLRRSFGGQDTTRKPEGTRWYEECVESLSALCAQIGVAMPDGFLGEAEQVRQTFDTPNEFWAFSPGDTCPDNHRLPEPESNAEYLRFFDFEFAGFHHALLDAAYLVMPFPTCWCVNRLPEDMILRLIDTYRTELQKGCAVAGTSEFSRQLIFACAFWLCITLQGSLEQSLKEDGTWGISSTRQRHLLRLDNFLWAAKTWAPGLLPAFEEWARQLRSNLSAQWPNRTEMPLYPAFRQPEET